MQERNNFEFSAWTDAQPENRDSICIHFTWPEFLGMATSPPDLLGCFFSFFVGLRQQTGYAAAHLEVSGLELTPGILPSNGCMMKTRRNLTDWAEVPITTQPVVSLPGTKD